MAKKPNQSDPKSLPACAVEYIRRLLKKMRYRRKVRDEVEAELTAHFEDELKDCKSVEEKEQKARQLVTDFGDFKLLAILLRRAKKRCRPLWRTIAARTFQSIGVLIVCFIFYAIWFSFGEPTIRVDYVKLLNQMNQPEIWKQDNAWPYYEKAFELYVPHSPLVNQFISYRRSGKEREDALQLKHLIQDNEQKIQAWLQKNRNYWDNLNNEQQSVLLKCLEYDWVPFPQIAYESYNDWRTTTIEQMTEHIIRCINEDKQITTPHPSGTLSSSKEPGFPKAELKRWLEDNTIPQNILEAVSVAVLHEVIKRFENLPEDITAPLTDVECENIRPWIEENEAAWRQFAAGSTRSYCYRQYAHDPNDRDKWLWSIPLPPLQSLKDLETMVMWRSRIDRAEGRLQQSIDDCLAIARSASHWQGKGTFIEQLVGLSISSLAHEEIITILADKNLSTDELQSLQEQLSKIYPGDYPLMNMEGERLVFMDVVQRSFTDGGPGGGHLIPQKTYLLDNLYDIAEEISEDIPVGRRFFESATLTSICLFHARRNDTVAKANEIYGLQSKVAGMTPYERHASNLKSVDEIMYESWLSYRFFLIQILMPPSERASEIAYRGKMGHEAAKTIVAILRWQLQKDQYPSALDELVTAGLLKELPNDPYSDKPLVYKKTDDDFTLYSVGPNFQDDGGEVAIVHGSPKKWGTDEARDIVFWPVGN